MSQAINLYVIGSRLELNSTAQLAKSKLRHCQTSNEPEANFDLTEVDQ